MRSRILYIDFGEGEWKQVYWDILEVQFVTVSDEVNLPKVWWANISKQREAVNRYASL